MKLVSYNILDGGEGRADPLAEVIEAHKPDIVVLVEADFPPVLERIAKRLNMDIAFGQGKKHGAAILSRWRITESINHALLRDEITNCLLEATIHDPDGNDWTIGAVHLRAHALEADEKIREREVGAILDVFKNRGPHLLAGDFNSNSPIQLIDPDKCKPNTREEWKANGGGIPRRAITTLLDNGYVDSLVTHTGKDAARIGSFDTQFPGQRVDYIFTHGFDRPRIIGASVERDRLAKYASDHFPITVEID